MLFKDMYNEIPKYIGTRLECLPRRLDVPAAAKKMVPPKTVYLSISKLPSILTLAN